MYTELLNIYSKLAITLLLHLKPNYTKSCVPPLKQMKNGLLDIFVDHQSVNSFRNKNSKIEISVLIITSFHLLLALKYLKFYIKNLSASLDETSKMVDSVEDFLPKTINE